MRINFDGSYSQILRLIETSNKPQAQGVEKAGFSSLLSAISPDPADTSGATGISLPLSELGATETPMASYKFSDPILEIPKLEPFQPAPVEDAPVVLHETPSEKTSESTVKTPTVLQMRRVAPENHFAGLSREQRMDRVHELVNRAAEKYGIDPALSMAVVANESSFQPHAVSNDGHASKGLFQLLDTTGKGLHQNSGTTQNYDPFNPELNVDLGVSYLRHLHEIFSTGTDLPNSLRTIAAANSTSLEKLAVAAFNAGEGRVASAQQRATRAGKNAASYSDVEPYLPDSTREYVERVVRSRGQFEGRNIG